MAQDTQTPQTREVASFEGGAAWQRPVCKMATPSLWSRRTWHCGLRTLWKSSDVWLGRILLDLVAPCASLFSLLHSICLSHSLTHSLTLSLALSLSRSLFLSLALSVARSISCSLSVSLSVSLSLFLALSLHLPSIFLSLSLSRSLVVFVSRLLFLTDRMGSSPES